MDYYNNDINEFNDDFRKRRSSVFKPTLEEDENFKKEIYDFLDRNQEEGVPFTWSRLATGYRVVDFEFDKIYEALDLLRVHFFCLNQSCAAATLYIDHNTFKVYQQFLLDVIAGRNSFCALEEGSGKLIGVAMANVETSDHQFVEEEEINPSRNIFDMVKFERNLLSEADIWDYYNIDKCFCIHAVCVKADYSNKGIATSLVRACLSRAQKTGNTVCVGIFPDGPSQTIARRLNFQVLAELPWMNIKSSKLISPHPSSLNIMENSFVCCMGTLVPPEIDQDNEEEEA